MKQSKQLTEREIRQLYRLLGRFQTAKNILISSPDGEKEQAHTATEQSMIGLVRRLVTWYAHNEMGVDMDL